MPRTRLLLALVAAGALTLAGCGSDDVGSPDRSSGRDDSPAKVANKKPSEDREPLTAQQLKDAVGAVALGESDVGHDVEVQDQDASLDAPTNDLCAKKWAGDRNRIARNQDFFWKQAKVAELVVSNESVAYQPGKGAAALAEIKKAVADCDGWEHGQGKMSDIKVIDPPDGSLDGAFSWQGHDERKGDTDYSYVAVYQGSGDLLSAVYVWAEDEDEAHDLADDLAPKAAEKLERAGG